MINWIALSAEGVDVKRRARRMDAAPDRRQPDPPGGQEREHPVSASFRSNAKTILQSLRELFHAICIKKHFFPTGEIFRKKSLSSPLTIHEISPIINRTIDYVNSAEE